MLILISIGTLLYLLFKRGKIPKFDAVSSSILIFLAILGLVLTPYGGDMRAYARAYLSLDRASAFDDPGWGIYTDIIHWFVGDNIDVFFFINYILFTLGFVYFAYKNIPKCYLWYFLLVVFISMGYHNGATNVLRSGLGLSCVFFGLSQFADNCKHKIRALIWCLIGCSMHLSTGVVVIALIISYFLPLNRLYLCVWIVFSVLSYMDSLSFLEPYILDIMGDESNRLEYYIASMGETTFYENAGFRFDFLFYSFIPIVFSYNYIYRYKYEDRFYNIIFCTYLITNCFWLVIIRMPYGDRFALLSWIFIPILTLYPIFKSKRNIPHKKGWLLAAISFPVALNLYMTLRAVF